MIDEVLSNMQVFAEAALGSAETSKTQLELMEQMKLGVDQIAMVVQNNSATAEETSAVSEELAAQATSLRDMVGRFKLHK